jgi:hypothetical protein
MKKHNHPNCTVKIPPGAESLNGQKQRPIAMTRGSAKAMLKAAEALEALERGEKVEPLPDSIIDPTREQVFAECRSLGIDLPPWPLPESGWFSKIFNALERLRKLEPPFCWQSKEALRRIREYMEGRDQWSLVQSRLLLYVALCEMASNRGTESFTVSQKALSNLSGLSARSQSESLRDLVAAGVIAMRDPEHGGRGQKTYTLLSVRSEVGSGRPEVGSERSEVGSSRSEVGVPSSPLPGLEGTREEHREEIREEASNSSEASTSKSSDLEASVTPPKPSPSTRKPKAKTTLTVPSDVGLSFADWFRSTLPGDIRLADSWRDQWARCYDDLIRLDKRTKEEISRVCKWARADAFCARHFLSPVKLRRRNPDGVTYFDTLTAQMNGQKPQNSQKPQRRKWNPPI